LEKKPIKSITTPILDLTEKSVHYLLSNDVNVEHYEKLNGSVDG
jgi:hypothetical protein